VGGSTDQIIHRANRIGEQRPVTLLIAALGGEGGGVLMNWIVDASRHAGFPVQATSIPGVAQRTGATTYYIELIPSTEVDQIPVMTLAPTPGEVDVLVSTELAEATRVLAGGFVTQDRTYLIASTNRHYMNLEKMAIGEGRLESGNMRQALENAARQSTFFDATSLAEENGTFVNALMLGAVAGSQALGIPRQSFVSAIRASGKSVDINIRGFELGEAVVSGKPAPDENVRLFPISSQEIVQEGVRRLTEFQNADYAETYLERLASFRAAAPNLVDAVARHLALRMSYDDIIRVAQIKIRADRLDRIRSEASAEASEPVYVTDFFKPGIPEIADLLPPAIAAGLLRWAAKKNRMVRWSFPMHVRSTNLTGFLKIWVLAKLKWWRPRSFRWHTEQRQISDWLDVVERARSQSDEVAIEVVELSRLIKGYGATHARGFGNYRRIMEAVVEPNLSGGTQTPSEFCTKIAGAREAALADSEGRALTSYLAEAVPENQIGQSAQSAQSASAAE
jgi:indolepyruvate ferredoxin oxidoreductase beta subunit